MNEQLLLRDENIFPDEDVLKTVLGDLYPVYREFIEIVTGEEYSLETQWNYYKDGKSWLCKVSKKKKTILWLSVWSGYFKTGFYFTEKSMEAILALEIEKDLKETFLSTKPIGKLKPLVIDISSREQLKDALAVVGCKILNI
ncbi:MAG TPA: hypothetical protein DEO54_09985 [Rikenellaceae bacterium]|nr:MAG: hypothetical protein A2X20_10685 [Bacteroidetes bacterium GWE2_40_15]HBZ26545.1 hypothetical protein [Rikenellaceae bacterium]